MPPFSFPTAWSRFVSVFMGSDNCGERISLRGDDTMRSCSLEEAALVGPGRRSESGVPGGGRRVCGRQRGGLCLGRVSIGPQRMCRLEQQGRPYCLTWEPARAEGWAVTWQHMVRLKMSRLCPGEHLTQGSQETCTRMFIAASCVIVESWTQPSYPSSRDGVNSDEFRQWESSPHHDLQNR